MNNVLTSDFQTVAASIAAVVFPKTQFQVLCQEIGSGVAITFKNPKNYSDNFRIKFSIKLRTLTISGYSNAGTVHLNYLTPNNYTWRNGSGFTITKPSSVGEKLEFLARKFFPILQEFYLGEFDNFSISQDFETAATSVVDRTFPQFNFRLNYKKNREKALCLNFLGYRNLESETVISCPVEYPSLRLTRGRGDTQTPRSFYDGQLGGHDIKIEPEIFAQKESIFFNVDFRSYAKCLAIHTRWDGEQYLLVYKSIGDLHWSSLQSDSINTPSAFGKEFETIATKLYPLLQEFFPDEDKSAN